MRRILSVNLSLKAKRSVRATLRPAGSLFRILYLPQASECSRRVRSSSGRFSRSFGQTVPITDVGITDYRITDSFTGSTSFFD